MLSLVHLYFHHFLIDNHAPNYLTAEVKISFCILLPFLKKQWFPFQWGTQKAFSEMWIFVVEQKRGRLDSARIFRIGNKKANERNGNYLKKIFILIYFSYLICNLLIDVCKISKYEVVPHQINLVSIHLLANRVLILDNLVLLTKL